MVGIKTERNKALGGGGGESISKSERAEWRGE